MLDRTKFNKSYYQGTCFSQTYEYPTGCMTHSAIVPLIADTIVLKKVTGHCGHGGKYFCSCCQLTQGEIGNFDVTTWPPPLTQDKHKRLANNWQTALTRSKQELLVKAHGVRWSALLKLSYW